MLETGNRVVIKVLKNDEPVSDLCVMWDNITEQEVLKLERAMNNVMIKMCDFGEAGGDSPKGDQTRGKLEFEFTLFNNRAFEAAWQGNRWTGITNAVADFMAGLLRGELSKIERATKQKQKRKLPK